MPRVTRDRQAVADLDAIYDVFSLGNYVVIYRPIDDGIDVLRVIEGHRDYPVVFHGLH